MKLRLALCCTIVLAICFFGYLYVTKKNNKFSITLGSADTPLTKVEIQGKEFLLEIDSGSKFQLTLNKDLLNTLEKQPYGILKGRDAKGMTYESPAYIVKEVKIWNHVFNDVVIKEVNENYIANTTIYTKKQKESKVKSGVIGRALLEKMNLFFDFKNFTLIDCQDLGDVKKAGYTLEDLTAVPFEIGRTGAILNVDTDLGTTRLSLDTGSTFSLIKSSLVQDDQLENQRYGLHYFNSKKFSIGNKDFGSMDLHLFDITPELHEIDGVLGMDFLINHVFYINYQDRLIYIGN